MRKVVAIEGKPLPGLRMLAPGACWVDETDGHIPVTSNPYSDLSKVLGQARDMRRNEENGEISFEIEFFNQYKEYSGLEEAEWTFVASPFKTLADETNTVTKARIREITMQPLNPGFPKDVIKMIDDANPTTEDSDVESQDTPWAPSPFVLELESVINRHSMENGSDTPDHILAEFLGDVLDAWNQALVKREKWYGRKVGSWMDSKVEDNLS